MHKFVYGSRIIQNERSQSLQIKVEKLGSCLCKAVSFLAMFLLLLLLSLVMKDVEHNSSIVTPQTVRLLEQGIVFAFEQIRHGGGYAQYSLLGLIFVALWCVSTWVITSSNAAHSSQFIGANCKYVCGDDFCVSNKLCAAVSYRHKVCFLS